MQIEIKKKLSRKELKDIFIMWEDEYPIPIIHTDEIRFQNHLNTYKNPSHFIIRDSRQEDIAGWLMVFDRESKTNFVMIVRSSYQHRGIGTVLLNAAKKKYAQLYGWVIDHNKFKKKNGNSYLSPLMFYKKNSFCINKDERIEEISAVMIVWQRNIQNR